VRPIRQRGGQRPPRIALVHDYLNQRGGAERVFAHIADAFPQAPVFTSIYNERELIDLISPDRVQTTFLQHLPGHDRYFRALAPLYPFAFESLDLRPYDLVISSTTAWAKGVRTRADALHICYVNTVSRFTFDYERYVGGFGVATLAKPLVRALVAWDKRAAQRPTLFIANSRNVAERVLRHYGRQSQVLPCPVDVDRFTPGPGRGDYYVLVSRLLPYKSIDVAIAGCALAGVPLHIIGRGPAEASLRALASGTQTTFHGYLDDAGVNRIVGNARAAIVPGVEDFGLVPLEAAAAGRPTIALGAGGALETIIEGETGEFFPAPNAESLAQAVRDFDPARYVPARLREHAERFAPGRFVERLHTIIDHALQRDEERLERPIR
jgi:glycosyltransferase involved in cell wall biosynthesis